MATALLSSSINPIKTHEFTQNGPKISPRIHPSGFQIKAVQERAKGGKSTAAAQSSADEVTQKYGLEVGLWKIFSSKSDGDGKQKSKTDEAKELLAKYGGAYLATSITLSLISFTLCYALVSAGIDIQALLSKIGIVTDEAGGKVGTFALAYAAHKAASPIRFPPTVALTPIVAGWIGKKAENTDKYIHTHIMQKTTKPANFNSSIGHGHVFSFSTGMRDYMLSLASPRNKRGSEKYAKSCG